MFMGGELTSCIIIIRIVLERFLLLIEAYLFGIRIGLNIRPKAYPLGSGPTMGSDKGGRFG